MNEELNIMNIIITAGEAKGYAYEALSKAKEGKFEEAYSLMEKSEEALSRAHDIQTSLLSREANGEKIEISILFIHAQDHLMTCMSENKLIKEIIELKKEIYFK